MTRSARRTSGATGVSTSEVAPDSLTTLDLGPDSVGASEVAADAIGSAEIIDGQVTNADLGVNSVTGPNVAPGSLSGTDIRQDSLSGNDILDGSLTSSEIGTGAVGSSEVADRSLGTGEFASSIPAVKVTRTANQSIPNASNPVTALDFDLERYDTAGMHSPSVNPSHLRAPVTGIYQLTASVVWEDNTSGTRALDMFKNGNTFLALSGDRAGSFQGQRQAISTVARLAAGDFVQVGVAQTSGGSLDVLKVSEYTRSSR